MLGVSKDVYIRLNMLPNSWPDTYYTNKLTGFLGADMEDGGFFAEVRVGAFPHQHEHGVRGRRPLDLHRHVRRISLHPDHTQRKPDVVRRRPEFPRFFSCPERGMVRLSPQHDKHKNMHHRNSCTATAPAQAGAVAVPRGHARCVKGSAYLLEYAPL